MTFRVQEFDYSVDLLQAILWEYDDAERLISLIQAKQTWYTDFQSDFWSSWFDDVFNLQTANDFGLAVWSIILGLPLFIDVLPDRDKPLWGFSDDGTFDNGYYNFDRGYFSNSNGGIVLTTGQKRLVLKLRYFQLVTRGAVPEINAFMAFAFEDLGQVYALDGLDMSMVYVFMFKIDGVVLTVLKLYDILPRPAAVGIRYVDGTRITFGFSDDGTFTNGYVNFDRGTFLDG